MNEEILFSLALIPILGLGAQWLAWRIKLPSILLLLIAGILAGPVTGVLDTTRLLGDLLFPVVSLSVAIILFEGGLSLRLDDLREEVGSVVLRLILIGVPLTWAITSLAARWLFGVTWPVAILLGSVLVVTGPTVIIPLIKQIRPARRAGAILRWEGIVIDPVGAILAVLVFEQILAGETNPGLPMALLSLGETLLIGFGGGFVSAWLMTLAFSRFLVPDYLQNSIAVTTVLGMFTFSNLLQAESGLLTVTIMGIVIANQKRFDPKGLMEFKENLQVLLLSVLFILLGARLEIAPLIELGMGSVLVFVLVVIVIERPLSVWLATLRSGLPWKERMFIATVAPRGIVAASVSSIFALELEELHIEGAELLTPLAFSVILGTVAVYSLGAPLLARVLDISHRNPQGVLIVGAHGWARRIALKLQEAGISVLVADTNYSNIARATEAGLRVYQGNVLSEIAAEELELSAIGHLLAMTSNDEVNALATVHFTATFGKQNVFQLPHHGTSSDGTTTNLGGPWVFAPHATFEHLNLCFGSGADLHLFEIKDPEALRQRFGKFIPMFLVSPEGHLQVWTLHNPPTLRAGYRLIALVDTVNQDEVGVG